MIAQTYRFRGHNSVDRVYKRAQTLRGSLLNLKYVPPTNTDRPYKVAVVVSRKVNKSAVVRNRIRRRIYELVRMFDAQALAGSQLVFIVYSDQLAYLESERLNAAVMDLLRRAARTGADSIIRSGSHAIVNTNRTRKDK